MNKLTTKNGAYRFASLLIAIMLIATLSGNAFATSSVDATDDMHQETIIARYRETVNCIRTTSVWQQLPYSVIDNSRICFASPGDSFNLLGHSIDIYGGTWWKVSIISVAGAPNLTGSIGYISTNDSECVIG